MTAPDPAEVERLKAVIARDLPACVSREPLAFTSNGIEGQVLIDSKALATAILSAGYSRTADTLERAAKVALNYPFGDQAHSNQAVCHNASQSIAAAIRAGKGE